MAEPIFVNSEKDSQENLILKKIKRQAIYGLVLSFIPFIPLAIFPVALSPFALFFCIKTLISSIKRGLFVYIAIAIIGIIFSLFNIVFYDQTKEWEKTLLLDLDPKGFVSHIRNNYIVEGLSLNNWGRDVYNDPSDKLAECFYKKNNLEKSFCAINQAAAEEYYKICKNRIIATQELKDTCYYKLAISDLNRNGIGECEKIINQALQNSCFSIISHNKRVRAYCDSVKEKDPSCGRILKLQIGNMNNPI